MAGAFACMPAAALEPAPERFPATLRLSDDGPQLALIGTGTFRFFFIRYYLCALYALPGLAGAHAILAADAPRRLALEALRRVTAFEFLWGLDRGIADNLSAAERAALADDFERIRRVIREVGAIGQGARVCVDYLPGRSVRLLIDDRERDTARPSKALADALFTIWSGERPLDPTLKEALVGA